MNNFVDFKKQASIILLGESGINISKHIKKHRYSNEIIHIDYNFHSLNESVADIKYNIYEDANECLCEHILNEFSLAESLLRIDKVKQDLLDLINRNNKFIIIFNINALDGLDFMHISGELSKMMFEKGKQCITITNTPFKNIDNTQIKRTVSLKDKYIKYSLKYYNFDSNSISNNISKEISIFTINKILEEILFEMFNKLGKNDDIKIIINNVCSRFNNKQFKYRED